MECTLLEKLHSVFEVETVTDVALPDVFLTSANKDKVL